MAQAGTLLSDLDGQAGGNDGDLVQQILQDMNIPTGGGGGGGGGAHPQPSGRGPPPPLPQQQHVYQQQMATTTAPLTMDSRIPTAHIIGNEHPTPAEFAAVVGGQAVPGYAPAPSAQMQVQMQYAPPQKGFTSRILDELKVPFVVALLFFVFSLSPIRVLVGHYLPSMIRPTGDFTFVGLAAIAGIVGAVFWLLHRVIAPLLSL